MKHTYTEEEKKKIAIRGHKTRGRDVIRALEEMGGTNAIGFDGSASNYAYYIRHDFIISLEKLDKSPLGESYSLYTIEEYEEYMKNLEAKCSGAGAEVAQTMEAITDCAKKLVEEEALKQYEVPTGSIKIWDLPNGYVFKDENGNIINATKIVLKKKKKEYPKTYEECCTVLRFHYDHYLTYNDEKDINPTKEEEEFINLMDTFSRLIVCRNAYWKLYGEEMGLGKPWEPDWATNDVKHSLVNVGNTMIPSVECKVCRILAFPTKEMRDAFKKNFDPGIEICKELL